MNLSSTEIIVALIALVSALLVAVLGGAFTLSGLLISKEQKISEFRQAWIDGVRDDLARIIAAAHLIHAHSHLLLSEKSQMPDKFVELDGKFLQRTRDDYIEINICSTRVELRLPLDEEDSKAVLAALKKLNIFFDGPPQNPIPESIKEVHELIEAVEVAAKPLLKSEWERVKKGEPNYQRAQKQAQNISLAGVFVTGFFIVIILCGLVGKFLLILLST
jgi:hypothetical protein